MGWFKSEDNRHRTVRPSGPVQCTGQCGPMQVRVWLALTLSGLPSPYLASVSFSWACEYALSCFKAPILAASPHSRYFLRIEDALDLCKLSGLLLLPHLA